MVFAKSEHCTRCYYLHLWLGVKIRSFYVVRSPALCGGEASSTPGFGAGSHLPQPEAPPGDLPIGTLFLGVAMLRTAIYPQEMCSFHHRRWKWHAHSWWQKLAGGALQRALNGLLWIVIYRHFAVLIPVSSSAPWKRPCPLIENWLLLKHLLLVCIQLDIKPTVLLQCKHISLYKKWTHATTLTLKPRAIRSQFKPKYTLNSFGVKLNKKLNYKHVRSPFAADWFFSSPRSSFTSSHCVVLVVLLTVFPVLNI